MKHYHLTLSINYNNDNYRVPGIKLLRTFIGMNLNDAKRLHDTITGTTDTLHLKVNAEQLAEFCVERELQTREQFPFIVHSVERVASSNVIDVSHL